MTFRASANTPITKEYIFKRVTQKEIFEHYLDVPIQTQKKFRSPFRKDKKPSCEFYWMGHRLRFKDWSTGLVMDCFDMVMKKHRCSFPEALKHVAYDMDLADVSPKNNAIAEWSNISTNREKQESGRTPIRVRIMNGFNDQEIKYLQDHGITSHQVNKYSVHPIDRVWVKDYMMWGYYEDDPALGYYFGKDEDDIQQWKIYFYKRSSGLRFICNTSVIQGYRELPKSGDLLVITKSLKDVMSLDSFGIDAIAPHGEAYSINQKIIDDLKDRFSNIISLYDFDLAGVKGAQYLKKNYGIEPLFFTNGRYGTIDYGAKDFSDFVKFNGIHAAQEIVNRHLIPKAINEQTHEKPHAEVHERVEAKAR